MWLAASSSDARQEPHMQVAQWRIGVITLLGRQVSGLFESASLNVEAHCRVVPVPWQQNVAMSFVFAPLGIIDSSLADDVIISAMGFSAFAIFLHASKTIPADV